MPLPKLADYPNVIAANASNCVVMQNVSHGPEPLQRQTNNTNKPMKIETYEIEPETTEIGQLASDGEHHEMCEKLGLEGQLSLSNNESGTVFPYRTMTAEEQKVFGLLFPTQTKLKNYKQAAIPLRVLQVASHALDCDFLHHITVWHTTDAKEDPVLVGHSGEYSGTLYLLARWGDAWKTFEELRELAKQKWLMTRRAKVAKAIKEIEAISKTIEADCDLYFAGDSIETSLYF